MERLSYKIIGACFEIYNELGYGHKEVIYQRALEKWFQDNNVCYAREVSYPLKFKNISIGSYRLDFLVENSIAVELKVASQVYKRFLNQVLNYLTESQKELGLCVVFNPERVIIKRVINGNADTL